jgi:cytochrome c peroxidase
VRQKIFTLFSSLMLLACRPESSDEDVRAEVRRLMLEVESRASFRVALSPEQLAKHRQNLELIHEKIPAGYPEPFVPQGALEESTYDPRLVVTPQLNRDWVELGQKLFKEKALSFSASSRTQGDISCQSCHLPDQRFTDGLALSKGVEGDLTHRNSPTLLNVAYLSTLTWANPIFPVLEMQARIPLFGDDPIEMGLKGREAKIFPQLMAQDPSYLTKFAQAFSLPELEGPRDPRLNYNLMTAALGAYQRTLIDFGTSFDRWLQGSDDSEAFDEQEMQGLKLFYGLEVLRSGDRLSCAQCHSGVLMTDSFQYVRDGVLVSHREFHNTGLYNLDGRGAYPPKNTGFASDAELEEHPEWMGRFRTPPLRFVADTAPYGHDGSLPTLTAVIEHYAAGGRASQSEFGQNPYVDERVRSGFRIDSDEKEALIAFLRSLR